MNANYTKWEWEFILSDENNAHLLLKQDHESFIEIYTAIDGEAEAIAHLIIAAVNGCVSTNPDNPMAVAESIKEMYEALKEIKLVWPGLDPDIKFPHLQEVIEKALAKAEGR